MWMCIIIIHKHKRDEAHTGGRAQQRKNILPPDYGLNADLCLDHQVCI